MNLIIKSLIYIFNSLLLILTVASAYGGMVAPHISAFPAILATAFPYIAIITIIWTVVCFFLFGKMAIVNILALLVCYGPLRSNFPINFTSSSAQYDFSLMSYNVYELRNYSDPSLRMGDYSPTIEYIIEKKPDIVAVQELMPYHLKSLPSEQRDSIYKLYPYRELYDNGQSILSRWPVNEITGSRYNSFAIKAFKVTMPEGRNLTIVNLHLRSLGLTAADKELYHDITEGHSHDIDSVRHTLLHKMSMAFKDREEEACMVREFVETLSGPVIVCGDFNDVPLCYAQRLIMGDSLIDAYSHAANFPAITFRANRFYFRIDHQLCNDSLIPVYATVENKSVSDHFPIIVNYRFSNQ